MNATSETKPVRVLLMEAGMRLAAKVFENAAEEIVVSASIGISLYPTDADDPEALVKNADAAMYRAKESRNSCEFYACSNRGQTAREE